MGKGLYSPHAWLLLAVPLLSGYRCYIYRLFRAKGLPFQLVEFDGRSDYGPFMSQDGMMFLCLPLSSPLLSSFSPPPSSPPSLLPLLSCPPSPLSLLLPCLWVGASSVVAVQAQTAAVQTWCIHRTIRLRAFHCGRC